MVAPHVHFAAGSKMLNSFRGPDLSTATKAERELEEHDLMNMALKYFEDLSREKQQQEKGLEEAETGLEQADVRLEVGEHRQTRAAQVAVEVYNGPTREEDGEEDGGRAVSVTQTFWRTP
ncbi:hypothetical protein B0H13DRAFT_1901202 [Mycena leptocephala]|nr:hypothetical protein B0H13DRAFT_1901202 [Mycena leptocephala]